MITLDQLCGGDKCIHVNCAISSTEAVSRSCAIPRNLDIVNSEKIRFCISNDNILRRSHRRGKAGLQPSSEHEDVHKY